MRSVNSGVGAVDHVARGRLTVARVQPRFYCGFSIPRDNPAQFGDIVDARINRKQTVV